RLPQIRSLLYHNHTCLWLLCHQGRPVVPVTSSLQPVLAADITSPLRIAQYHADCTAEAGLQNFRMLLPQPEHNVERRMPKAVTVGRRHNSPARIDSFQKNLTGRCLAAMMSHLQNLCPQQLSLPADQLLFNSSLYITRQ